MEEIWKPIEGYKTLYQISNCGRVKSLNYRGKRGQHQILKAGKNKSGYMIVVLTKNHKQKTYSVHQLVASAFLKQEDGLEVHHKDSNKENNYVGNLEYVTHQMNCEYRG